MGTQIEVRRGSRVLERFDSDLQANDVDGLVALLRRRAGQLRERPEQLELRARSGRHKSTVRV